MEQTKKEQPTHNKIKYNLEQYNYTITRLRHVLDVFENSSSEGESEKEGVDKIVSVASVYTSISPNLSELNALLDHEITRLENMFK